MNALQAASGHPVTHLAFSPDGLTLAAAQPHTGVTLFDRSAGQPAVAIAVPRVALYSSLLFCGSGLAVGTSHALEVFDPRDGSRIYHADAAWARGLLLAVCGSELRAASPIVVFRLEPLPVGAGTFRASRAWDAWERGLSLRGLSPDGRWLVALRQDAGPLLLDGVTGEPAAAFQSPLRLPYPAPGDQPGCQPVVFAHDSRRVAVLDGRSVRVFGLELPAAEEASPDRPGVAPPPKAVLSPVLEVPPPEKWPEARPWFPPVAFTPDGRSLLVRRPRNRVQMWDVAAGCVLSEWSWRLDAVLCLAVAPDGLTAAAGGRLGRVVVWDLE